MPRYYFHIRDALGVSRDDEGTELPDLESARQEAKASARDLIADAMKSRKAIADFMIDIVDQAGAPVETLPVRDLLI